jgi:ABC-type multidrug transport system ATPase subunit
VRALIADSPIVVVDEPTLELDERSARAVQQWIAQLADERGKTVLLRTCAPDVASAICDRVVAEMRTHAHRTCFWER